MAYLSIPFVHYVWYGDLFSSHVSSTQPVMAVSLVRYGRVKLGSKVLSLYKLLGSATGHGCTGCRFCDSGGARMYIMMVPLEHCTATRQRQCINLATVHTYNQRVTLRTIRLMGYIGPLTLTTVNSSVSPIEIIKCNHVCSNFEMVLLYKVYDMTSSSYDDMTMTAFFALLKAAS